MDLAIGKRLKLLPVLVVAITIQSPSIVMAEENAADLWTRMGQSFASSGPFDWTLAEAHITESDRSLIYRTIAKGDTDKAEERSALATAHVKLVGLAVAGPKQIVVFGPEVLCGGTGNCPILVFARVQGRLRLVLDSFGSTFFIRRSTTGGFHDVATFMNSSADSGGFGVYHWIGAEYRQFWCVSVQHMVISQGKCGDAR